MIWVFVAIAAVLTVAIAVFAVNRVTGRLAATAARSVYDIEEATEHIADRLPDKLAGKLSYEDVQAVLHWHLEYLRERGLATFGRVDLTAERARRRADDDDTGAVVDEDETVDYVLARAMDSGRDIDAVDVVVVLHLEASYLRAIGAVGDELDG